MRDEFSLRQIAFGEVQNEFSRWENYFSPMQNALEVLNRNKKLWKRNTINTESL